MTFQDRMREEGTRVINDDFVKWRSCQRKKRHADIARAQQAIKNMGYGRAYECEFCFGFHVTGDHNKKG